MLMDAIFSVVTVIVMIIIIIIIIITIEKTETYLTEGSHRHEEDEEARRCKLSPCHRQALRNAGGS